MVKNLFVSYCLIVLLVGCSPKGTTEPLINKKSKGIYQNQTISTNAIDIVNKELEATSELSLPNKVYLEVPFSAQAPFADWDDPRQQEGCEEMSAIMVHHYLQGTKLNRETALTELMDISKWEKDNGYPLDVNLDDLGKIIEDYYGYKVIISEDVTEDAIKTAIASGNPVILPAAGRKLDNPYFSGAGPWYHMLVVTGYNRRYFVTNDPGTRRGQNYKYRPEVLLNAVHDWMGEKERISEGRKVMLIVKR